MCQPGSLASRRTSVTEATTAATRNATRDKYPAAVVNQMIRAQEEGQKRMDAIEEAKALVEDHIDEVPEAAHPTHAVSRLSGLLHSAMVAEKAAAKAAANAHAAATTAAAGGDQVQKTRAESLVSAAEQGERTALAATKAARMSVQAHPEMAAKLAGFLRAAMGPNPAPLPNRKV